jgi:hypothetical protein
MISIEQLIELAKEVETGDPIDWGMLAIDENQAYNMIALGVLEHFSSLDKDSRETALLASVVKITVENFVLNFKLLKKAQE